MIGNVLSQAKIALSITALLALAGASWYVYSLQKNLELLEMTVNTQERIIRENQASQRFLNDIIKDNEAIVDSLSEKLKTNRERLDKLTAGISDNNVDKILQRKPGLLEDIIRRGYTEYYKELEEATK